MRGRAVLLWAALGIALVLVIGLVAPAGASQATQLQTARDTLANCMLLAANPVDDQQRTRAETCIQDQTRIVDLLTAPSSPSSTPTPTGSPSPTVTPTSTRPTPTPSPSPTSSGSGQWPSPSTTGTPPGWTPQTTRSGTWQIGAPGVYQDVRVLGSVQITVPGVTLRRVSVEGGIISTEWMDRCYNGLTLDQVTVRPAPGQSYLVAGNGAIGPGGYTARRVAILDSDEGFRVSGRSVGCGKTVLEESFVRIRMAPGRCPHADGVQLYDGGALDVTGLTIDWQGCGTTAFFGPGKDGNVGPVTIRGLLIRGGGYALTLGVVGSVTGYRYAGGAAYSAGNVRCDRLSSWEARVVTIGPDYQVTADRGALTCPRGDGI